MILRGRITPFKGGHFLLMENKDDFFLSFTVRDKEGEPGMKTATSAIRVEVPPAAGEPAKGGDAGPGTPAPAKPDAEKAPEPEPAKPDAEKTPEPAKP